MKYAPVCRTYLPLRNPNRIQTPCRPPKVSPSITPNPIAQSARRTFKKKQGVFYGTGTVPAAGDRGHPRRVRRRSGGPGLRVRREAVLGGRQILDCRGQGRARGGRRNAAEDAQGVGPMDV